MIIDLPNKFKELLVSRKFDSSVEKRKLSVWIFRNTKFCMFVSSDREDLPASRKNF